MVDPKTGKKIKYWVSPMDPTYIRKEPGKSPMGMDRVTVYEEEGEDKEPASTAQEEYLLALEQYSKLGNKFLFPHTR